MATTEIHAITSTPAAALEYIRSNKLVPYSEGMEIWQDCIHKIVDLNGQKYVEYMTYTSYFHCRKLAPMYTYTVLENRGRNKFKKGGVGAKNGEPVMYHLHQSFNGREVDPITANEIGQRLCEEVFDGFAVTVSTHTNGNNIHNHFMISAWNYEGKKWHNCHATTQKIRTVSDRLCEEYGLSVLEKTREMKLVKYRDANGTTRFYEPTDRKNELLRQRREGKISSDDVGSYRNTAQFVKQKEKALSNKRLVQQDIDALLPLCRSFEDLLTHLRNMGYRIKDKKKNGDWLAHISYQSPAADKPTREDTLGDGKFYLRENLTARIAEQAKKRELPLDAVPTDIPYWSGYEYGETDLSQINDNWRKVSTPSGNQIVTPRSPIEQKIIAFIRKADAEVRSTMDPHALRRLAASQKQRRQEAKPYLSYTYEQQLVARIQDSFRCLQYTERNNIYDLQQVRELYRTNQHMMHTLHAQLDTIQTLLVQLRTAAQAQEKAVALQDRIEKNSGDILYRIDGLSEDKTALKNHQSMIRKFKTDTPEGAAALAQKIDKAEAKLLRLRSALDETAFHMRELENCMRIFERLEKECNNSGTVKPTFQILTTGSARQNPLSVRDATSPEKKRDRSFER